MKTTANRMIRIRSALLAATFVSWAVPAHAYRFINRSGSSTSTSSTSNAIRWPDASMPITWYLDPDATSKVGPSTTASAVRQASIDAFAQWVNASPRDGMGNGIEMAAPSTLTSGGGISQNNKNTVAWLETGWSSAAGGSPLGSGVLGLTVPQFTTAGEILEADIIYNAQHWRWQLGSAGYSPCLASSFANPCLDAASIELHEQGHFLGMDHSCEANDINANACPAPQLEAVMAAYYAEPKPDLMADDTNGIQALYGSVGSSGSTGGGGGGGATVGSGELCAPCTDSAECAIDAYCIGETAGATSGFCSTPCGAGNTCPTGTTCYDFGGATGCYPSSIDCAAYTASAGGVSLGGACSASTACADGLICVGITASEAYCYVDCSSSTGACASNETCEALYNSSNQPTGSAACLPAATRGESCSDIGCADGLICVGATVDDAICALECTQNSAACASSESCQELASGRKACMPDTGGGGSGTGTGTGTGSTGTGTGSTGTGSTGTGSTGTGSTGTGSTGTGTGSTGTSGSGGSASDRGCGGCTSGPDAAFMALVGLAGLVRRRARRS